MEKDHFEILLEHIESNTQLLAEGQAGMNERLNRLESGQEEIKEKLLVQDVLEAGQKVILTRLDKIEAGQKGVLTRLDILEAGQKGVLTRLDKIEAGQKAIKSDTRDTRRNMGLLNSIANDHESRLQGVESKLKDHLENHS